MFMYVYLLVSLCISACCSMREELNRLRLDCENTSLCKMGETQTLKHYVRTPDGTELTLCD